MIPDEDMPAGKHLECPKCGAKLFLLLQAHTVSQDQVTITYDTRAANDHLAKCLG